MMRKVRRRRGSPIWPPTTWRTMKTHSRVRWSVNEDELGVAGKNGEHILVVTIFIMVGDKE